MSGRVKESEGQKAFLVVGGGSMKRQGFLDKAVNYLKKAEWKSRSLRG